MMGLQLRITKVSASKSKQHRMVTNAKGAGRFGCVAEARSIRILLTSAPCRPVLNLANTFALGATQRPKIVN